MEDNGDLDDLFPYTKSAPAKEEVYRRVRKCLVRLTQMRSLIRLDKQNELLHCDHDFLYVLCERFEQLNPGKIFRLDLDAVPITEQMMQEMRLARTWILRTITLQARFVDNHHFMRVIRSAIEKEASARTDMEQLYMALTDCEFEEDPEDRLDNAFAIVLHHNFATTHSDVLKKLEEMEDRRKMLAKKRDGGEAIRSRIMESVQSVKVDHFACAIPVSTILESECEDDHACPICRNEYLEFESFPIQDLINDYPVKIKFCGHVIGKSCLETWMATPLADPAKYPHRTCPLCRVNIEGREPPPPPRWLTRHVENDWRVSTLMDSLGLGEDECWDGILKLMSDEIVLSELKSEVEQRIKGHSGAKDGLTAAKQTLEEKLAQTEEEKKAWGFGGKETGWLDAREEWARTLLSRAR